MPYKDKTKQKEYYLTNKERLLRRGKDLYNLKKDEIKKYSKEYYHKNKVLKGKNTQAQIEYWHSLRGKTPWNKGKKLPSSWNRGKKWSEDTKIKMSIAKIGKEPPNKGIKSKICGKLHHNWRGGVTKINDKIRRSIEYKLWRKSVFERDKYTCSWCKMVGGNLHADHIKPFAYYPELRFAIDNGRTLCLDCHKTTETYGYKARKQNN